MNAIARSVLAAAIAGAAVGCAHAPAAPADALQGFAAAVERRDYPAAYAAMSAEYRQRVPLDEFSRALERSAREAAEDARALREGAARAAARVEVSLGAERRVALVREGSGWRLDAPPVDPYGQGAPRDACRSFVRAVENRRYDVLLQLAPARYRTSLTVAALRAYWEGDEAASRRASLRELRLALDGRIVEEGDEAVMPYGAGQQVRLVREDGLWRVDSPE